MIKKAILKAVRSLGYEIVKTKHFNISEDLEPSFLEDYKKCQPYTMTSIERMYALYKAIEYIVRNKIPGDIVECGVWKGGSSMLAALTLKRFSDSSRKILLYDTFEGMSEPTKDDITLRHEDAKPKYQKSLEDDGVSLWCYASISEVKINMEKTGYPPENIYYIKGKVEDTIPNTLPDSISLLRLDTDWYESTLHELNHLYPKLSMEGVLIIDDYGHWQGARKATDQYFEDLNKFPLLSRIDYTGRLIIKNSNS